MKTSTPFLGRLAAAAERAGLPYKFLLLLDAPDWISPDDKPHYQDNKSTQPLA
jgi:hypothetical protein